MACSVWLYAVPVVPAGKEAVAIVKGTGGFTVKAIVWVADTLAASMTWIVTELLPAGPVGVPVMAPVLELRLNPEGRVPAVVDHVYGLVPPDILNVAL